ncbi:MAG: NAD(P)-dependent dehydrogenase (short-subunit alcohol dehydrogenase family), partial [Candidatus Azotimanducaceae bacterium]
MTTLNNKNVFITGGGSGIGLACAHYFANRGANVLIMGRSGDKLTTAAAALS